MARRKIIKTEFNEKAFGKALKVVEQVLSDYGVELGQTIRYKREGSGDQWEQVRIIGINKDLSIMCVDKNRAIRHFLPGYYVSLQVQVKGPRGGKKWIPLESVITV